MMIEKKIAVPIENSAFVYAILESLEGMAAYSTLNEKLDDLPNYCILRLLIPSSFEADLSEVLAGLRKKFPILELAKEADNEK